MPLEAKHIASTQDEKQSNSSEPADILTQQNGDARHRPHCSEGGAKIRVQLKTVPPQKP